MCWGFGGIIMIVFLILHLEEERMFVGKNIVQGNNKKKVEKVAKLVSTNHKQQQHIFTQKEEEEEEEFVDVCCDVY